MPYTINMCSKAESVKGQGVGSATAEAIALVKNGLGKDYRVCVNQHIHADITHIHSVNPSFYLSIPSWKKHGMVVGSVHFLPETVEGSIRMPSFAQKAYYKYIISMYKKMDYLVTVNPVFIEKLARYGINKERVQYIPNFVDEKAFYPVSKHEKRSLRLKYRLSPEKFTVVCAGQLQTRKGVFDFVKCAKKMPEVQFVWAGGFSFGAISDGHAEIKKLMETPPGNVFFLGIVNREEMNDVYNLGDMMFLPSFEELFPMTILEAMNCRLPILVRDLELYRDILFDFYLKSDRVDGFVELISRLRDDQAFYQKASEMSWNGHLFYNKEHVLSMWAQFYRRVAADLQRRRKHGKRLRG